ncbi:MAG: glycosyltransferase family 4 protein [Bacilli bacterium]|jgi:glycosyltransferase involved in cell wall biosynthesis
MKILAVCQFYHPENFTITPLLRDLAARGHQVTVITGRPNAGFGHVLSEYRHRKFEIADGVKVHRLPILARKKGKLSLIANYFSFYFLARAFVRRHRGDYDVVFAMSLSPVISMVPALDYAKRHHLPSLLYCVDIWPESVVYTNNVKPNTFAHRVLLNWSKRIYQAADRLLVGSPSYFEYMEQEHQIPRAKMDLLLQPALNEHLGIAPINHGPGTHLVYIGNLGQVQLLDELLEAVKSLKGRDLHVHIVGNGSARDRLLATIKNEDLSEYVHMYGYRPIHEAVAFIPDADVLLVPLKAGGYVGRTIPNKLVTYMGYGRPILGALTGDGRALLEAAGGGIVVEPSTRGLIEGIKRAIDLTEEEKNALGARNLAYFKEHLTLEKVGAELESYLSELVK